MSELPEKIERSRTTNEANLLARQLIRENNVNFDDLIKNLRHTPELYDLVYQHLIEGQNFSFNAQSDRIQIGLVYGIFAERNGRLAIHNLIYQELIYNYMSANAEHTSPIAGHDYSESYRLPGNRFNAPKALRRFQELLCQEYSDTATSSNSKSGAVRLHTKTASTNSPIT